MKKKFLIAATLALGAVFATSCKNDCEECKECKECENPSTECNFHVIYAEKAKAVADSISLSPLKTCTMEEIERQEGYVDSNFGFEFWYVSPDADKDAVTLFEYYKEEATKISSNKDMPIFWSESYGNKWIELNNQQVHEKEYAFYFTLPNKSNDNGGDIDEKGQIWLIGVRIFDEKYIRVIFRFDNLKANGRYYQYDKGDNDIRIHY